MEAGSVTAQPADDPAEDGNDCTDNACDGTTPIHPDLPAGTPCGAGGALMCDGAGQCTGCTMDDQCSPDTDCINHSCDIPNAVCVSANIPNDTPCTSDNLYCTGVEVCQNGICASPGNPCAPASTGNNDCAEICDEVADDCNGNNPDGFGCDDGLYCTETDSCQSGSCVGTGNPCQPPDTTNNNCREMCNEGANNCTGNNPNGSACNDGLYCTQTDTCQGGVCTGAGNPCSAPNPNNNDCTEKCNENANNCSAPNDDGFGCDDGLYCTTSSSCQGGMCVGFGDPCTPLDPSSASCFRSCNEATQDCTAQDPDNSRCFIHGLEACCISGFCNVMGGSCNN